MAGMCDLWANHRWTRYGLMGESGVKGVKGEKPVQESQEKAGPDAGNGLYGRRYFIQRSVAATSALLVASPTTVAATTSATNTVERPQWMRTPGAPLSESSGISEFESHVKRHPVNSQPGTVGSGASRTPLQHLEGLITPSRLHFERHHSGIPSIDPDHHKLYIHGLVRRPLAFDVEALARYPMVSRIQFLECSGNSAALLAERPVQADCASIHGLISTSEWSGVPLALLLEEAGVAAEGKWVVADGADAAVLSRSVPMEKILDDAIVALYQNGERLRPANGYPMRLFLPGWEGNASIKWLRSLKVTTQPMHSREETSKYSDLDDSGIAQQFTFPMAVKSIITSPSPDLNLKQKGIYQISGMAWSGSGRIERVEVSSDGGISWAEAMLDEHILSKCVTRFRAAWDWQGKPAILLSRATDETGSIQPTRAINMRGRGVGSFYHVNAIQAWQVSGAGEVANVYV